jgi:hypothetical protein
MQDSFQTFQKHKLSGLPKVLQGEEITPPQEKQDTPPSFRQETQDNVNPEKFPQETKGSSQNEEALQTINPETKEKGGPGHLSSMVSLLLLHHLLLISLYLRLWEK